MGKESGSGERSLVRRSTTVGVSTAAGTAAVLGGLYVEPTVLHAAGTVAGAIVSTGEGVSALVGTGVGLAAAGIISLNKKSHWVDSSSPSTCGTVDPEKTRSLEGGGRMYRCGHDGTARRLALRHTSVYAAVVGAATLAVGGGFGAIGIERGPAALAMELGTAVISAGAVAGGISLARHRSQPGLGES